MRPVYLDYNATTPLSADALEAMSPYLRGQFGNPLTSHRFGLGPRAAVDAARREVAALVGEQPREDADAATGGAEVIFCSGGSEALNHAVKGLALPRAEGGARRIVIGATEHYAVARAAGWLADRCGFEVVSIRPDRTGRVPVDGFLEAVDGAPTAVAALMWANNETGTVQPVREVGDGCRGRGVPFVCDAVQAVGKLDMSGALASCDVVALSAHKFYGPKGVGALVARPGLEMDPLLHGAQQEGGRRAGTHNAAGIAGMGAAARAARSSLSREPARLARLRDELWRRVYEQIEGARWNGQGGELLANTLNVSFEGCPSHLLCDAMDGRGFAISAGAACRSGAVNPAANLLAMGASESVARSSVRISLGHGTVDHDVVAAASALAGSVAAVRASL